ncbi:hypothetical protein HOLleu_08510 [Holothuria leucospilota]|uniref:PH domain-containing protein n=1 Tax=Holothuria leucospilota TaxID=206669 RepID=A0A9Q1CHN9_HOLLE|nr:hypothetical protein HOLleu_08510 [Holothuria leucospilota]
MGIHFLDWIYGGKSKLTCGARYLFQAKDDRDMLFWICRLSAGTGDVRSEKDLLFTQMKAPERGSPSRTDRLKNFIRGSLSAVMK